MRFLKRAVSAAAARMGYDIVRNRAASLVGLSRLPICSILDVGANRGQFARRVLKVFPRASVYCFEPLREPFEDLQAWSRQVPGGAVHSFHIALGDTEGEVVMLHSLDHDDSSSVLKPTDVNSALFAQSLERQTVRVRQTTLDQAVRTLIGSLAPEILVKLDVNGYEDRVIRGGRETLGMARACIVEVCLDLLFEHQATFAEILSLMRELGFTYAGNLHQVYGKDGHVIFIDAVFIRAGVQG